MILKFLETLFLLLMGHALADFALQSDVMAKGKNRHYDPALYEVSWLYWMTAHSLVHGLCVAVITRNIWLGLGETVFHWYLDFLKCEKITGIHSDQLYHVLCKVMWVVILIGMQ